MPMKANLVRKTVIDNSNYDYCHLRSVWFEEWKNGKIENIYGPFGLREREGK